LPRHLVTYREYVVPDLVIRVYTVPHSAESSTAEKQIPPLPLQWPNVPEAVPPSGKSAGGGTDGCDPPPSSPPALIKRQQRGNHSPQLGCLQRHACTMFSEINSFGVNPCLQVAVWDHIKVYERTVWKFNSVMTNNLAFMPGDGTSCCSSSSDGTLKVFPPPRRPI